jgi:hypothetical protein
VLTATRSALYLAVGAPGQDGHRRVLPVVALGGLPLPTAVTLGLELPSGGWGVAEDSSVLVGDSVVRLPGAEIRMVRAWSPPRVPTADGELPAGALAAVSDALEPSALRDRAGGLCAELVDGADPSAFVRELVGAGPGLTPSGDDALCGVLLALRLLGPRTQGPRERLWDAVRDRLHVTTSLSASLLTEAADGYAVPPVARLCEALMAGDEREALDLAERVAAVGHSSGRDLLAGLVAGLEADLVRRVP